MKKEYLAPNAIVYSYRTTSCLAGSPGTDGLPVNPGGGGTVTPWGNDDDIVGDGGMAWMKNR